MVSCQRPVDLLVAGGLGPKPLMFLMRSLPTRCAVLVTFFHVSPFFSGGTVGGGRRKSWGMLRFRSATGFPWPEGMSSCNFFLAGSQTLTLKFSNSLRAVLGLTNSLVRFMSVSSCCPASSMNFSRPSFELTLIDPNARLIGVLCYSLL